MQPTKTTAPTIAELNKITKEHARMEKGIKSLISELEKDKFYKHVTNKLRKLIT